MELLEEYLKMNVIEYDLAKAIKQSFAPRIYPKIYQLKQYKFNYNCSSHRDTK